MQICNTGGLRNAQTGQAERQEVKGYSHCKAIINFPGIKQPPSVNLVAIYWYQLDLLLYEMHYRDLIDSGKDSSLATFSFLVLHANSYTTICTFTSVLEPARGAWLALKANSIPTQKRSRVFRTNQTVIFRISIFGFFLMSHRKRTWLDHFPYEHTHKKWNLGSSKHGHLS